jgi:hypothetical protein
MANAYSMDDLLGFLDHAAGRGLMPAATAKALAVASRSVLGVLGDQERKDLNQLDLESVVKRFNNKRAKDFNSATLREYGRRLHRAVDLFLKWREDPATFTVKTRSTAAPRKKEKSQGAVQAFETDQDAPFGVSSNLPAGTYRSALPVRPGIVITLDNIPHDLTKAEAERLANFVRMLAVEA